MLPTLSIPVYPFVPIAPGVPSILRAAADRNAPALLQSAIAGSVPPLLTQMLSGGVPSMLNGYASQSYTQLLSQASPADAATSLAKSTTPFKGDPKSTAVQWGIFDKSGALAIKPDSIVSVGWSGDFHISSYPIEAGSFQSYNKVREPFIPKVIMRRGGSVSDRQKFITTLDTIRASLDLYTVTTPEVSYASVSITHVAYDRKADKGLAVIEAELTLQQVITNASSAFTNTATPQSQDAFNGGTVEATPPTSSQAAAVSGSVGVTAQAGR